TPSGDSQRAPYGAGICRVREPVPRGSQLMPLPWRREGGRRYALPVQGRRAQEWHAAYAFSTGAWVVRVARLSATFCHSDATLYPCSMWLRASSAQSQPSVSPRVAALRSRADRTVAAPSRVWALGSVAIS